MRTRKPIQAQVIVKENERWLDRLMASIPVDIVDVVFGEHVEGNTNRARAATFAKMTAPFVTWFDPDDELGDSFAELAAMLDGQTGLVCGDEVSIREDGSQCGLGCMFGQPIKRSDVLMSPRVAHKAIIPRASVGLAEDIVRGCPYGIEWALSAAGAMSGDVKKLTKVVYKWRKHPAQAHRFRVHDFRVIHERILRAAAGD